MQSTDYNVDMSAIWSRLDDTQESGEEHSRLLQNLGRCLREDLSPRQRTMLVLHYGRKLSQAQIAVLLGVNRSTVCRTLKRGEQRLQRCLRYGAQRYLMSLSDN